MVAESYPGMPDSLTRRAVQDKAQSICSKVGKEKLTQEEAAEVVRLSRESMKYPAAGKLAGDWKAGARLAYAGQGGVSSAARSKRPRRTARSAPTATRSTRAR
jgi:sulfur-oxidizing protein SoxX